MWLEMIGRGEQRAWFLFPLLVGLCLGVAVPGSDFIEDDTLRTVSSVLGWQYFLCWTISFYPQVVLNYQKKSVRGLSIDFQILNLIGFASYSVFNCSLYWCHTIKEEYQERYGHPPGIHINDVAFSLNALALCCISFMQCFLYDDRPWDKVFTITKMFCVCSGALVSSCLILLAFHVNCFGITWMTCIYVLSYIKLATTLVKYIPQIMLNYSRGSTVGFSCVQVLLDFQGGILSISQQVMDAVVMGHSSFITGNLAKLGLGLASICFDGILMTQHWIMYPIDSEGSEHFCGDDEAIYSGLMD